VAVAAALLLAACSSDDGGEQAAGEPPAATSAEPSAPVKSLTALPTPTLSGKLTADLRQSSRDVALGRFEVWLTNGTEHEVRPTRIVYHDPMLTAPVVGERLRPIPSGSYRGYPLELIEPTCGAASGRVSVVVEHDGERETLPVEDETSVVGRWSEERCAELAIDRVASLKWTPGIEVQGSGADAVALFKLTAHPTGDGGSYTVDTVTGTPLFTAAGSDFWTVGQKVTGTGPDVTMELPAQPARCDIHAFGSATGGTTFFVNVTIEGSGAGTGPAQVRLAMSPEVTNETFAYAAEACGWDR
jgi:hypothetical protein